MPKTGLWGRAGRAPPGWGETPNHCRPPPDGLPVFAGDTGLERCGRPILPHQSLPRAAARLPIGVRARGPTMPERTAPAPRRPASSWRHARCWRCGAAVPLRSALWSGRLQMGKGRSRGAARPAGGRGAQLRAVRPKAGWQAAGLLNGRVGQGQRRAQYWSAYRQTRSAAGGGNAGRHRRPGSCLPKRQEAGRVMGARLAGGNGLRQPAAPRTG